MNYREWKDINKGIEFGAPLYAKASKRPWLPDWFLSAVWLFILIGSTAFSLLFVLGDDMATGTFLLLLSYIAARQLGIAK